jgi:hypothetical protein
MISTEYVYCRYKKIDPIKVQTGDIVEVQVSFSTVPLKGDRYKMLLVLRSIAIIDTALTQVRTYCVHTNRDSPR